MVEFLVQHRFFGELRKAFPFDFDGRSQFKRSVAKKHGTSYFAAYRSEECDCARYGEGAGVAFQNDVFHSEDFAGANGP